jgi:tetratricopeptide (TPR) repeat protein
MQRRPGSLPSVPWLFAVAAFCGLSAWAQSFSDAGAAAYQQKKDWQGLVRYATAWTQAEPNNPVPWGYLGSAYAVGLNQPDKAIAPLKRAVALQPSAESWHALGATYTMVHQYGDAVDAIKRAIQLNPNQPVYYNNLAAAYSGGGAFKAALAALDQEKPLAQRLNSVNVWWALGNGYAKLGDLKNATPAYRQVLQMNPNFAQGWTNLGVALQFTGDVQGAQAAYGRGQALGDPLAGQDAARLQADLRAQAQQRADSQSAISRGMQAEHMLEYMHMK